MKKLIALIISLSLLSFPMSVLAANTYSISLNGSSQYLTIANADGTTLAVTGDLTMEAWVNFSSTPAGSHSIMDKRYNNQAGNDYYMSWDGDTNTLYAGWQSDSTHYIDCAMSWTPTASNWYHVEADIDVSAQSADFFINGSKTTGSCGGNGSTSIGNNASAFTIGALHPTDIRYFPGLIDEVRISDTIRHTANFSVQTVEYEDDANTMGLWHLNNDATDASGNGNTLSLVNSPTYSTNVPFSSGGGVSGWESYLVD